MNRSSLITIGILVLIVAGAALFVFTRTQQSGDPVGSDAARVLGGERAEEVAYTDLEGEPFTFEQFEGRVRVVNSWASWCPFCVNELPDLAELAAEYADKDVAVIAVNRKESRETAKAFIASLEDVEGITFVLDPNDAFYGSIGGFTMPETVFYDQSGNEVFHKRGFMDLAEMRIHTQAALESDSK